MKDESKTPDTTTTRAESELSESACSALVNSIAEKARNAGRSSVLASNQYGMGFILSSENEILYRDDKLSANFMRAIAGDVNSILK